jgi:hypothetical protein
VGGHHRTTLDLENDLHLPDDKGGYISSFIRCQRSDGSERFRVDTRGHVIALSYATTSDRNAKQDFQTVEPREILAKVVRLPISTWAFKTDPATRHAGPMAQDFAAAFNLGDSDRTISTVDADGIALAALQGLHQQVEDQSRTLRAELQSRDAEVSQLKERLNLLEALVRRLATPAH